jgi:hypothetical protein
MPFVCSLTTPGLCAAPRGLPAMPAPPDNWGTAMTRVPTPKGPAPLRPPCRQTGTAVSRRFLRSLESANLNRFWISRRMGEATKMEE